MQESENSPEKRAPEGLVPERGLSKKRGLSKNTLSSSAPHSGEESVLLSLGHAEFWFSPSGPPLSPPGASSTSELGWRPEPWGPAGLEGKGGSSTGAAGRQHLSSALSPSVFSSSSSRSRTHIWACRMPAQNTTCVDVLWLCLGLPSGRLFLGEPGGAALCPGSPREERLPRCRGSMPEALAGASALMDSGASEAQLCSP